MLRQGNVKLIGEPFPDLALNPAPGGGPPAGGLTRPNPAAPGLLDTFIATAFNHQAAAAGNEAFARIYGFSFEGHYYDLPRPVIMLVDGPGSPLPNQGLPAALSQPTIGQTDEATRSWDFSGNLFEWNYDKMSMSIRLEIDSGTLQDILLARALGERSGTYGSGAYGSGAYGSGAYGSGAYGSGAFGRGRRGGSSD